MDAPKGDDIDILRDFWGYALIFTAFDLIIMVLPVIQLEFLDAKHRPLNFYLLSELLSVISLIDPLLTMKYKGKEEFLGKLNIFKICTSCLIIITSNVL